MRTLVWRNVFAVLLVVLALVLAVGWMSSKPTTGTWGVENHSCPVGPAPSIVWPGCNTSPVPMFYPGTPSQQP
jgi:hypothetical protein